ncbi:MAG: DUF4910 domain-containing protein, partial [Rhodospirillales bacterium]
MSPGATRRRRLPSSRRGSPRVWRRRPNGWCRSSLTGFRGSCRIWWTMSEPVIDSGAALHRWATDLFPICRNVAGEGVRSTLAYLKDLFPGFDLHHVPSGTKAFDWIVPDEWNISAAWLEHEDGTRVADFDWNNLHVVGYSEPIDCWIGLDEL